MYDHIISAREAIVRRRAHYIRPFSVRQHRSMTTVYRLSVTWANTIDQPP